jgi:death-on-curing protein
MSAPVFLTIEQVKTLHRLALDQHGGQDGVRDAATLESAVMHPCNVWLYGQGDCFDIAAAYAFHLAQAQAFLDGNKRNGVPVPEATEELYAAMIAVAERRMDKVGLAALLRRLAEPGGAA